MKKAVAYLRRSTDRQEQSLPDQEKAIRRYADRHGYEILRVYQDDAVSGTSANGRRAFEEMMADSERPSCDFRHILVYDVSRFSRADNIETGYYLYLLRKRGIEVIYVTENLGTGRRSDGARSLKQTIALEQTVEVSEKTFRGLLTISQQGFWLGGVPPYGYDLECENSEGAVLRTVRFLSDGRKEIYRPDGSLDRTLPAKERIERSKKDRTKLVLSLPERVEVVKRIAHMYRVDGFGFKAIAERLNGEKIPSPRGGAWSVGAVRSILRNPLYTGDMVWNRRAAGKFHQVQEKETRDRLDSEFQKLKINGKEDWIVVPNTHPAITHRESFDEIQQLTEKRARKHSGEAAFRSRRAKNSPYLLSGLMRCARCCNAFQGYTTHSVKYKKSGGKIVTHYYACSGYVNKGNSVCQRYLVGLEQAEGYVLDRIDTRVERYLSGGGAELLRQLIRKEICSDVARPQLDREEIAAKVKTIEADIDRLLDSLTPVNKEFVDKKLMVLGEEKTKLEQKLKEMEVVESEQVDPDKLADEIVRGLKGFRELFEQGTQEERKEFVRAFVEQLVIDPDKGTGTLYIREFPALESIRAGNSSFEVVAGARVVYVKKGFPPIEVEQIPFRYEGTVLVPALS